MIFYFLWLITSGYSVTLGAYPTLDACHEVGAALHDGLKEMPSAKVICIVSLGSVPGMSASPDAPAAPQVKPAPGSLPDAPALLEHGLRLIGDEGLRD